MIAIEMIVVCLVIGVLLCLSGLLSDTAPKALGGWIINVALPATTLGTVHNVTMDTNWLMAAASPARHGTPHSAGTRHALVAVRPGRSASRGGLGQHIVCWPAHGDSLCRRAMGQFGALH
jgi:hypothetical protein